MSTSKSGGITLTIQEFQTLPPEKLEAILDRIFWEQLHVPVTDETGKARFMIVPKDWFDRVVPTPPGATS